MNIAIFPTELHGNLAHNRPQCKGKFSYAAESAAQLSASFDRNGDMLLRKTEQLVQRVGGQALAIFADSKRNCNLYASEALQGLFEHASAITFFRDELVHK